MFMHPHNPVTLSSMERSSSHGEFIPLLSRNQHIVCASPRDTDSNEYVTLFPENRQVLCSANAIPGNGHSSHNNQKPEEQNEEKGGVELSQLKLPRDSADPNAGCDGHEKGGFPECLDQHEKVNNPNYCNTCGFVAGSPSASSMSVERKLHAPWKQAKKDAKRKENLSCSKLECPQSLFTVPMATFAYYNKEHMTDRPRNIWSWSERVGFLYPIIGLLATLALQSVFVIYFTIIVFDPELSSKPTTPTDTLTTTTVPTDEVTTVAIGLKLLVSLVLCISVYHDLLDSSLLLRFTKMFHEYYDFDSICSKFWMIVGYVILLLRMAIAFTIFFSGLVYIHTITDQFKLLMGGASIRFIFTLDSLIFEAIAQDSFRFVSFAKGGFEEIFYHQEGVERHWFYHLFLLFGMAGVAILVLCGGMGVPA